MTQITINNLTAIDVAQQELESLINFAVAYENLSNISFSIVLVDDDKMRELNQQYRRKDTTTDVLAFALEETDFPDLDVRLLGDIYISVPQAKRQANEQNHSLLQELAFLMLHGFYHLLGFDHSNEKEREIMWKKQKEVLDKYGIA